ncbi:hypothetical protein BDR07DRAFT_1373863 [Suillus spraguei]|nr:hypothetical protein BDR07DRAFT_1373863 [Suillus spraguei]
MNEDHPPQKKRWGLLKRSRSNPHLAEERGRRAPSSPPPSRNGSRRGLSRLIPAFLGKCFARSAQQSPNPGPIATSSSARDLLHRQISRDIPLPTATTPEPNLDQPSDLGVANRNSTITLVKAKLASAKAEFDRIKNVSGIVQNAASASDKLQSVSDTFDTFSPILKPLKVFNSIATTLAEVHPYAKVALSIFTYASKVIELIWATDDS